MTEKNFENDDPMELVGMVLPGSPGQIEAMAQAMVEEYVLLGWEEKRLMTLFTNPFFLATHRVYQQKGEAFVRSLVRDTWSALRIARQLSNGKE